MLYSAPLIRAARHGGPLYPYKRNPIMTINAILQARANAKCELCGAEHALTAFPVPHSPPATTTTAWRSGDTCRGQLEQPDTTEVNHWRCLATACGARCRRCR